MELQLAQNEVLPKAIQEMEALVEQLEVAQWNVLLGVLLMTMLERAIQGMQLGVGLQHVLLGALLMTILETSIQEMHLEVGLQHVVLGVVLRTIQAKALV